MRVSKQTVVILSIIGGVLLLGGLGGGIYAVVRKVKDDRGRANYEKLRLKNLAEKAAWKEAEIRRDAYTAEVARKEAEWKASRSKFVYGF